MHTQKATAKNARTNLEILSMEQYMAVPGCYRSEWTTERTDMPEWDKVRHLYIGKKTLLRCGALEVQGISFVIKEEDNGLYEVTGKSGRVELVRSIKSAVAVGAEIATPTDVQLLESQLRETGEVAWSDEKDAVEIILVNAFHHK